MFNITKKLGAAALVALFTMGSASAVVLDTFSYDEANQVDSTIFVPNTVTTDVEFLGIAGLTVSADYTHKMLLDGLPPEDKESILRSGNDYLSFDNDSGVSAQLSILYYAMVADQNGPFALPLDFTLFGSGFYFDTVFSDADIGVTVTVTDVFNNNFAYSDNTTAYNYAQNGGDFRRSYIGFNNFVGIDMTKVTSVLLTFDAEFAGDFTLSEYGVIPEPSTVAIFGLALVGFAFSSRRKAK